MRGRKRLLAALMGVGLLFVACGGTSNTIKGVQSDEAEEAATAPHESAMAASAVNQKCGYVRWNVKTGQDALAASVNMTPKATTIANLSLMPSPLPKGNFKYPPEVKRQPSEMQVYTFPATILAYRSEADSDIHLELSDGQKHTMIAELPDPRCMSVPAQSGAVPSQWINQVTTARNAFLKATGYKPVAWSSSHTPPPFIKGNFQVTATGVAFFDYPHSQFGVAPNAIEMHPILGLTFKTSRHHSTTTTAATTSTS